VIRTVKKHMKFRVIAGTHYQDRKRYVKGQVVSSPQDLVKLFTGKFERLPDTVESSAGSAGPPPTPGTPPKKKTVKKPVVEEDDE